MASTVGAPGVAGGKATLLRSADFRRLWLAAGISALGSGLSQLALPLLVLAETGSAALAGLIGSIRLLAYVLAVVPGGALADRLARRPLLVAADGGRAGFLAVVGVLVLTGQSAHPTWLAVLTVLLAAEMVCTAAAAPASTAAVAHVVSREQIPAAVRLAQARTYGISLVAPLLGGVLFELHPAAPFLLDALSYLASLVLVIGVRRRLDAGQRPSRTSSLAAELTAGIRYLCAVPLIRRLAGWAALVNFATAAMTFGLVLLVAPAGADRLGQVMAVLAVASLAGAVLAPLGRRASHRTVFGASTAGMAVLGGMTVLHPTPVVVIAGVAGICAMAPTLVIAISAEILTTVPDEVMGRVQAALSLVASSLYPGAAAMTGWLVEHASLRLAFLVPTAVLATVLIGVLIRIPAGSSRSGASEDRAGS